MNFFPFIFRAYPRCIILKNSCCSITDPLFFLKSYNLKKHISNSLKFSSTLLCLSHTPTHILRYIDTANHAHTFSSHVGVKALLYAITLPQRLTPSDAHSCIPLYHLSLSLSLFLSLSHTHSDTHTRVFFGIFVRTRARVGRIIVAKTRVDLGRDVLLRK